MVKNVLTDDNLNLKLRTRQCMKKQFKLLPVLAILIVGMFAAASRLFIFPANATYVEGVIQQDTVWTLTDSPFVVINDVIVKPGFTLTIEPGVEVRFGGNFSLIVEGRLNAVGTQNSMIRFTSNKNQPTTGDWNTILFVNRTLQSTMIYNVVQYATNGITIQGANVDVENSEIDYCQVGIYATGDNTGLMKGNTVELNTDGVFLDGNTSGTTIENNTISANSRNGVSLQSNNGTSITNVVVFNNTLSSNSRGISIFGQVTTNNITRNSVSYNSIGILFESVTSSLSPQKNDIYGNTVGINASLSEPVNATYNYWGDQTGPYHVSLNPNGKGNPVQSNGKDIYFIPFLSAPSGYINARPVARLLSDKTVVTPNQDVVFIATTSTDDKRVDKYFFNFGDGKNSGWTTLSIFYHEYSAASPNPYQANVTVMDDFGAISNNVANVAITVQAGLTPIDVSLTLSQPQMVSGGHVSITVRAMLASSPLSNANITLFSVPSGTLSVGSGLTNSTGYFTSTLTVTEEGNLRITARASKSGNADGSDFEYLEVVPPLTLAFTANPTSLESEDTSSATVRVTYNSNPVQGATVTLTSDSGGTFSPQTNDTDANGYVDFTFKAPQTLTQLDITLTAMATKTGYWEGSSQIKLSVNPRILILKLTADPSIIESKGTSSLIAHVTSDGTPIANATVAISSNVSGNFSAKTGNTDASGNFTFTFTSAQTTAQTDVTITVSASKTGYVDGQNQTVVTVKAAPNTGSTGASGLPLTTILLILIPIVVVVIVVVLIKTKVIVFNREEES
jgi:parallel beta-helix repeat protein